MNIGILGAGNIASKMAETLIKMNDATCFAVGSRELQKAKDFADKHGIQRYYGDYEALCYDKDIDLIYVATPHSHHYEHTKMALLAGKHVLCEKSFTSNLKEAEELIKLSEDKKLLLAEAMWTRYMPLRDTLESLLRDNIIGTVSSMDASLCYPLTHVPRLLDPKLSGGALLDLGVYTIHLTEYLFGLEGDVQSVCVKTDSGVDKRSIVIITYPDGKIVKLYSDMSCVSDNDVYIYGDNGYLYIRNINNYEYIEHINKENQLVSTYTAPPQITGFEYQVNACIKAIKENKTECDEVPHKSTLAVMKMMDSLRENWGVQYPSD